ncbi:MAG TPA: serine/threonine-protein kinase [Dokdonella sp.]
MTGSPRAASAAPATNSPADDGVFAASDSALIARLRAWFDALVELPADSRAAWLAANVADADERAALERLLAADGIDDGLLDVVADEVAARLGASGLNEDGLIGQRVGAFRLTRLLGKGGMAAVFLGEREHGSFRQQVAVKLLRRGLYSEIEQRLFLRERQVLARLAHPNIARLFDGDVTDAGIPFLVMEYVDGEPITRHAAARGLDVRRRLELFLTVCAAVESAHRALIVHRDIKPSNVLVAHDGTVKLLDFGIAKLLDDGVENATHHLFTPDYAAPEQIHAGPISTATDVYALGVLLHELLLGTRPERGPRRRASSAAAAADGARVALSRRRTRALLGDLDTILLKALADEPARRYASAGAFAEDVRRHLDGRPVEAHPPSTWYRMRKFTARHRGTVAATAAAVLALLAALTVALWQARIAHEQARVARAETQRANATRDFIAELFESASASLPRDQRPTPERLIEEAAKRAHDDPGLEPSLRAQILLALAKVAASGGDYAQAEALIDDAIARERALPIATSSPLWTESLVQKGNLLHVTNRNDEADRLMAGILPQLLAQDTEAALSGLMLYGATRAYAGRADEALAIARQAFDKAQRVFGPDSIDGIEVSSYLGQLCATIRRDREAASMLEQALAHWRALQLPQDEEYARTLFHLGAVKARTGERAAVEPLYREGIALMRRVYDGPHDRIAAGLAGLGAFLVSEERFDEAEAAFDEALAMDRRLLGEDNAKTVAVLDGRAALDLARRRYAEAERADREALRSFLAHAQASGYEEELATTRLHLAEALIERGGGDEAARLQAQAARDTARLFGESSAPFADAVRVGGCVEFARGEYAAALAAADRALATLGGLDSPNPNVEIRSRYLRASALAALGRRDEADREAVHALAALHAAHPDAHVQRARLLALRARIARALGRADVAAAAIAEADALHVPTALLPDEDAATLH